jgi:RNA polymerase sigma-70 factor (ECF subfamily)
MSLLARSTEPARWTGRVVGVRDSSGFDEFYADTSSKAIAYVYAITGVLADSEDAVAEAYARAWQRWERVGSYEDPAAWVRRVAHRVAVSTWRRARNRKEAHHRWGLAAPVAEVNPDTVALVDALRQIPPAQRRAIVLYHLVGLSVQEIANETDSSVSAVKHRLSRGRQALAPLLGTEVEEVEIHA